MIWQEMIKKTIGDVCEYYIPYGIIQISKGTSKYHQNKQ